MSGKNKKIAQIIDDSAQEDDLKVKNQTKLEVRLPSIDPLPRP